MQSVLATAVLAQDKYDVFFGQYMASIHIASACEGVAAMGRGGAAHIAKSQDGLREKKVIRLSFYSDLDILNQLGNLALASRNIDVKNRVALCRFGHSIAGRNDTIGRFLVKN